MNMNKLQYLKLNNINLDFAKSIANIKIYSLKSLELSNKTKRIKAFDENEIL